MVEQVNFKYCSIEIKNGIMECTFNSIDTVDIEIAKIVVQKRIDCANGISYPCIFDVTQIKNSTKEARDYFATEGNKLVKASAIIVNTPILKFLAHFYIAVNKPLKPTKWFTKKVSARRWLEQFKDH